MSQAHDPFPDIIFPEYGKSKFWHRAAFKVKKKTKLVRNVFILRLDQKPF
jgi:hypothetical protein